MSKIILSVFMLKSILEFRRASCLKVRHHFTDEAILTLCNTSVQDTINSLGAGADEKTTAIGSRSPKRLRTLRNNYTPSGPESWGPYLRLYEATTVYLTTFREHAKGNVAFGKHEQSELRGDLAFRTLPPRGSGSGSFVPSVVSDLVGVSASPGPIETINRLAYSVCGRPMENFSECNQKQSVPSRA
ncbi:hypothetical protein BS47DRAFT_1402354 [Hydnum rufescens UP504]|uniref:Uncharacterized protein n=1 Tax=Hydnum rufescens UP504 TaxID=1448309 RepID=A0A9P6ADS3_9AGAM|nr:hypothetical protein BS47DRAFT_1402354 [Hydnum rufescens UP504]